MEYNVRFKIMANDGKTIIQDGYLDLTTLDEEEPHLYFYDENGVLGTQIRPNNHEYKSKEFWTYENTMNAFIDDDDFFKLLQKFKDEDKTIKRDGYILVINEGED